MTSFFTAQRERGERSRRQSCPAIVPEREGLLPLHGFLQQPEQEREPGYDLSNRFVVNLVKTRSFHNF
jgi:hypothetical protein